MKRASDHGDQVYTVELIPLKRVPRFKGGQFLHLALDEYDPKGGYWPDSRVFSIASLPESETIVIAYSVKGSFTTRMANELSPGKEVWLKFPYGHFIIENVVPEEVPIVLIAGGTGITAFVAFLQGCLDSNSRREIMLFYGVRKTSLILFGELLRDCQDSLPSFSVYLYSEQLDASDGSAKPLAPNSGSLAFNEVWNRSPLERSPYFFLSGPPAMVAHFQSELHSNGVVDDKVIIDEWE